MLPLTLLLSLAALLVLLLVVVVSSLECLDIAVVNHHEKAFVLHGAIDDNFREDSRYGQTHGRTGKSLTGLVGRLGQATKELCVVVLQSVDAIVPNHSRDLVFGPKKAGSRAWSADVHGILGKDADSMR